jgi:hypothetical protein
MTSDDLIVVVPWIIFGAGLSAVFFRLLRSSHGTRRQPRPPPTLSPHTPSRPENSGRPPTQEAQCSEKNTEAFQ